MQENEELQEKLKVAKAENSRSAAALKEQRAKVEALQIFEGGLKEASEQKEKLSE